MLSLFMLLLLHLFSTVEFETREGRWFGRDGMGQRLFLIVVDVVGIVDNLLGIGGGGLFAEAECRQQRVFGRRQ